MTCWCFRVLLACFLTGSFAARNRTVTVNRFDTIPDLDPVKVTRCDAACYRQPHTECHNHCLKENVMKAGVCPLTFENVTAFARACLTLCLHDSECPLTEKCCTHSCGRTCQPAVGLEIVEGLPPIPYNVTAVEKKGKSVVMLKWEIPPLPSEPLVLYMIQQRHHFGRYYNQEKLGGWNSVRNCRKTSRTLKNVVKSARWYQFRVAAVSLNGTRGFSDPSDPFFLSRVPSKPQPPTKLRVVNVREHKGRVWGDVRWSAAKSELPVQRYKVFWSKRLPAIVPSHVSDSVVVNIHSVPQNQVHFPLENLEKGELYFIQVQALSIYGRDRLKSKKAEMFFNTTRPVDQYSEPMKRNKDKPSN